jgi:hypothetical protein
MAASRSAGLLPNSNRIRPMVFCVIRASVPRHPACTAATARFFGSTSKMGTQSAVATARSTPGSLVVEPSPFDGCAGAEETSRTRAE